MSNGKFLAIVGAIIALMVVMMLADQTACHNADGTPCLFGGGGRGAGSGISVR